MLSLWKFVVLLGVFCYLYTIKLNPVVSTAKTCTLNASLVVCFSLWVQVPLLSKIHTPEHFLKHLTVNCLYCATPGNTRDSLWQDRWIIQGAKEVISS